MSTAAASPGSHRLASVAGVARGYDANGNTTALDGRSLAYDQRNRLSDAPMDSEHGTRFVYSGRGERVGKLRYAPVGHLDWTAINCSILDVYAYDERGQLLSEYSSGAVDATACAGSNLSLRATPAETATSRASGKGAVVTAARAASGRVLLPPPDADPVPPAPAPVADYLYLDGTPVARGGMLYYLETDHLGTPRSAITAAGQVQWRWDFFGPSFGEHAPDNGSGGSPNLVLNLRYPGQYYDEETGSIHNGWRDYDQDSGRYIEFDPLGLKAGPNGYGYVGANPLKAVDPSGLLAFSPDCTQQQRDSINLALMDMFIDLLKKCNSGGANCGDGNCKDCKNVWKIFQWYATEAKIQCHNSFPCAQVNAKGNGTTWLWQPMIDGKAPVCGCMKGVLLHEVLHGIDPQNDNESDIGHRAKNCISCAPLSAE